MKRNLEMFAPNIKIAINQANRGGGTQERAQQERVSHYKQFEIGVQMEKVCSKPHANLVARTF